MDKKPEILIIIDGNALVHRSFHALPTTMKRQDGTTTNAVYGFTSFLLKAIQEFKPRYAVVTFDEAAPTFRHEAYIEYKANRVKAPDELYEQIPLTKEVLEAFEIPIFSKPGFEADDLIGTICQKVKKEKDLVTYIITGDMDTLQLVDDKVKVYTMSRGLSDPIIYDATKIEERYGLLPNQVIDYKALRGDPGDNIPGVKGIGEKTAVGLLNDYGTLENIYQNVDEAEKSKKITPRIATLLRDQKESAFFSKELATINIDSPLTFDLEKAKLNFSREKVADIFSIMNFRSLLNRLPSNKDEDQVQSLKIKKDTVIKSQEINSETDFKKFFEALSKEKSFALSLEVGVNNKVSAVSIAWKKNEAFYLPLNNSAQGGLFGNANPWLEKLKTIFENQKVEKVGHDLKTTWHHLMTEGINLDGLSFDAMLASYLLDPGRRRHDLQTLAFLEFGLENMPSEKGAEAALLWQLKETLLPRLKKEKLFDLYLNIEQPLIPILGKMENTGIALDQKFLKEFSKKLAKRLKELEKEIHTLAGSEFNINSTKQLKEVLFERLALPTKNIKKSKTGFSTAEDELDKLADLHPIIPFLKEYRELNKLRSTYIEALPLLADKNSRIHTTFNQTVAATGRLSSTEPNLQNIPVKTELGKETRRAFVSAPGKKLLSLDYSQIELRLAAHLSNDPLMIKAFHDGDDIHTITAAAINGVEENDVTKKMRREAKAVNFGILYGQGPHGLAQGTGISFMQAKGFIDKYFETYKGIKKMMNNFISQAEKDGESVTMFGRRRPLPDMNSEMVQIRKMSERMAINTPIQGAAADLIKIAMINIDKGLEGKESEIKMLLQVHDELIFEVDEKKVNDYAKMIKNIMENAHHFSVPIVVEASSGDNWNELKKLGLK
ncbi:MAG: DNA polymerase I [Candidatus Falkowbacteria bacterium]|nr:DNA polymerase I [Candidatus Falkowbacteria bacterium]